MELAFVLDFFLVVDGKIPLETSSPGSTWLIQCFRHLVDSRGRRFISVGRGFIFES